MSRTHISNPDFGPDPFDVKNPNKLPRGCLWHGATVLRANKMTGEGITVAIIDAGIDASHPGFKNKAIISQDPGPRVNAPEDMFERTTHLAGTIHFMAPNAKIRDYRVFNNANIRLDKVARALEKAVLTDKVDLVLLPFGLDRENKDFLAAIEIAKKNKVHVVSPAGKDGVKRFAPTVFAVEGVKKEKNLPKIDTSEEDSLIDYVAQGLNEYSFKLGGGFSQMSGAAVAAAHFTGLLACILSKYEKNLPKDEKISREKLQEIINENYNVKINRPSGDDPNPYGNGIATALAGQEGVDHFTDLREKVADIKKTEIPIGPHGPFVFSSDGDEQ